MRASNLAPSLGGPSLEADIHRAEAEASRAEGALAMVQAHLLAFYALVSSLRAKALDAGIMLSVPSTPTNAPSPSAEVAAGAVTPTFMKVKEYAEYRGFSKRTIEMRLRDGMPIEGQGRYRRVNVKKADEWFEQRGQSAYVADAEKSAKLEEQARKDAAKHIHARLAKTGAPR